MEWLLHFFGKVGKKPIIFYTGHRAHVRNLNRDESDGFGEAEAFDDGYILDDDSWEVLVQNATGKA
jgi:hypothetical protein